MLGIFIYHGRTLVVVIRPKVPQKRNATTPNLFARFLDRRQLTGRCGAEYNNQVCTDNQCCSSYGYCGNEFEYCGEIVGCQPNYGRCGDRPIPSSTPTPTPTPTPSSSSSSRVIPSSSSSSPPLPSGTMVISLNGQCGNVTTCAGSGFGNCCSEWYFCGNSNEYCGTGCRSAFGNCGGGQPPVSSPSSSTPTPTPTIPSSTPTPTPTGRGPASSDGRCGDGYYCDTSTFGRCCSDYGWCGNQEDYCRIAYGCQPEWGLCGTPPQLIVGM
ncbi:hypothetical protein CC78DRAFT_561824 [Lojkania enalia]|uniref:Chitin-binding type-1 domain-containing protein n=1 Tax=Lojkania enalia TaxID=147567 RepID=A0A9P4MXF3_9PLEO|nr:hypothetical protein CC78DRAFT_561824 [Didymosphaeria enalia]